MHVALEAKDRPRSVACCGTLLMSAQKYGRVSIALSSVSRASFHKDASARKSSHMFVLETAEGKMYFYAETDSERQRWVLALRACLSKLQAPITKTTSVTLVQRSGRKGSRGTAEGGKAGGAAIPRTESGGSEGGGVTVRRKGSGGKPTLEKGASRTQVVRIGKRG